MENLKTLINHPYGYLVNFPIHLFLSSMMNGLSFGIISTLLMLNIKACIGNGRQNVYGCDIHIFTFLNFGFLGVQLISSNFTLMVGLILILIYNFDTLYDGL